MNNKVYEYVTERILSQLESGNIPWQKPWVGADRPTNLVSKHEYRGINVFLLSMSGFASPYWLTLNQARAKGGSIKKGSKSHMVVFYKTLTYKDKVDPKKENKIPLLRYYNVFNLEQCTGIEAPKVAQLPTFVPIEEAERIVREMPKRPTINPEMIAVYHPFNDTVGMPDKKSFISPEHYYSTIFHELAHSTGHESRLKRFDKNTPLSFFGSESYSKEELVAEMCAAMLCATLRIENKTIDNTVAYINSWRQRLSADPKLVVQAANAAQKAADFILNVKKEEKEVE